MINKVKKLFQKSFEVYKLDLKLNKKTSFRSFEKDFEAREFLRKILDEKLKLLSYETKSEYTLADDYFNQREIKYLLPDCDFDEDTYIKEVAPKIFNQQLAKAINSAFKKVDKQKEELILKDIQNCKVLEVNSNNDTFEIVYERENQIKYLTIKKNFNASSMAGVRQYFTIDNKKLKDSSKTLFLQDMKTIVKIFHLKEENPYYQNEFIEILFKDSKNITSSYRLNIDVDEDFNSLDFLIRRYKNIFKFKSKTLNDEYKTEFNFSYDDEFFYAAMKNDRKYKDGTSYRGSYGDYPYYSCITYGKKVFFEIDDDYIKGYNLGFLHNQIIEKKYFDLLSKNEQEEFKRFLSIAELYINDLEINQKFDNEILFDYEKDSKNYDKLDILNKNLKNSDFKKELIYYNGEQGHPSTKEVYIYTKDDKKLFYFWEIEFYGDYDIVTIKYNDDLKTQIDKLFEEKS
jgi:hypothetical protein